MMPEVEFVLDIAAKRGGGERVIELGCGYGYLTLELARNGLDVMETPRTKLNSFDKDLKNLDKLVRF